ncbi:MAG: hypothetical protein LQ339_000799 [Xanthoria mediterranea]|nr:MAG: hypothetical protein LQ339_000799 [Xanthoria mediterranea]
MYAKTAAIILGAMAAMGSASPVASPAQARDAAANSTAPGTLASQAITHLFVCTDADFKGRCQNLENTRGACTNLGNGLSDSISSLGPDQGTTCTIWE